MRVDEALTGVTHLGLDSPPIIYFIEAHPRYGALVREVFGGIARGSPGAITSLVSVAEVLVDPFRRDDLELVDLYQDLLFRSAHLQTLPIDPPMAESAARLRARYRLRTPDALQVAAALAGGCEAFLTNDVTFRRVTELRILILDELEL